MADLQLVIDGMQDRENRAQDTEAGHQKDLKIH